MALSLFDNPLLTSTARMVLPFFCILYLGGCALHPPADDNIVKQAATLAGLASPAGEPADFVRQQRPKMEQGYLPVGVTPPSSALAPRKPEEVKALEAELNAQRNQSRTFANRPAPKSGYENAPPPKVEKPPPELMPQ